MGSNFTISVVCENSKDADQAITTAVEEITRIERLISSWDDQSSTSAVNRMAGLQAVPVDSELMGLIERAQRLSILTNGAFDITYASMDRIWKFDGSVTVLPSKEEIKSSISKVGFNKIVLDKDNGTVFLKEKGMKIGFGAIGKGYAADQAMKLLKSMGIQAGIINASGDLNAWGKQPDGSDWNIAITNPLNKTKAFGVLPISNRSMATSGNYEKFLTIEGKRYAHIIDPRTGYPTSGIVSVSIFAHKAELADALATSVFVMGIETGLNLINQIPDVECIIVDESGQLFTSENLKIDTL